MMQHFIVLQERDDFCGVRVVPIGKLFEKNTAGRRVAVDKSSTAECPLLGAEDICSIRVLPALTHMYGPAVRCKWFRRAGGERSCINVSGLRLERVVLRAIMDISARACRRDRRRRCRTLVELNTSGIVACRQADGSKRRINYKGGMVHARENHVASDSAVRTDRCTMPSDRR
jgi:hypothetical protein